MEDNGQQAQPVKSRKGKRGDLGLGFGNKNQFQSWEVGANYKCEKLLGSGSYGQVA